MNSKKKKTLSFVRIEFMIVTNIVFYVSSHVNIQNKCVKCPTEDDDGIFYLRRLPGNAEEKCGRQALPSVQGLLVPVVRRLQ
jgi:hypothetical protein